MGKEEKKMEAAGDKLLRRIETNIKHVALDIHANLVDPNEGTPRDTGWAANNWVAQVGSAFRGLVGSRKRVDSSKAMNAGQEISKWKSGSGPIFISNNVPYIGRLNAGSSSQAPAGFIEKAVQRAINALRRK